MKLFPTTMTRWYPVFNPDLAPSDFHWFLHLKNHLGGQRYNDDNDVETSVMQWLVQQTVEFYEDGVQKLIVRYD